MTDDSQTSTVMVAFPPGVRCWVHGQGPYAALLYAARPDDGGLGHLADELTVDCAVFVAENGGWTHGAHVSFLPPGKAPCD